MIPPNPNNLHPTNEPGHSGAGRNSGTGSTAKPSGVYLPMTISAPESKPFLPPALNNTFTPQSLFRAFRKRWASAVLIGLVLASATGIGAYLALPSAKWTAKIRLVVAPEQPYLVYKS